MPLEVELQPDSKVLPLDAFVAAIDASRYDWCDEASLLDAAKYLKQLNNNKAFLVEKMLDELTHFSDFQRHNYYGPQVFLLYSCKEYFLRANVWRPISDLERRIKGFRYDICHDHNFDILTAGYFGPGYTARCYTYDERSVRGLLGERVTLLPDGLFTLSEGRVALYRAKRDVHIQMPPERLSVSLNLIPRNNRIREVQCQFDERSGTICRYLQASGAELIVRLAGVLGDEACTSALNAISRTHPSPQMRALAAVSFHQITSEPLTLDDASPLVPDIVEKEMTHYGTCLHMHLPAEAS